MRFFFLTLLIILIAVTVQAQFTAGNLVVTRVGDGTAALVSTSTIVSAPINLYEFSPFTANQSVPVVPKVTIGTTTSGNRLTVNGGKAGEGQLNLSADGKYLCLIGYDQPIATAEAICTAGSKVIGRIDKIGVLEYSSSFLSRLTGNAKTAITMDGNSFYTSIDSLGYIPWNQTSAPTIVSTLKPIAFSIINSQLYAYESYGNISYTNIPLPTFGNSGTTSLVKLSSSLDARGFAMLNSDANTSTGYGTAGYDVLYVSNKINGLEKYFWNTATKTWLPANSQFQLRIDITNGGSGYTTAPTITIGETWVPNVTYATNQFVCNRTNGRFYQVTTGGTSGTVIPTVTSGTVTATDGTAVYTFRGYTPSATAILTAGVVTSIDLTPKNAQQFVALPYTMVAPPVTIGAPASGVQATLNAYYPTVPFYGSLAALTATLVNGKPVIYALTGDGRSTNNNLIAITDASGGPSVPMTGSNSSTVTLATAGVNYGFRGVAFAASDGIVVTPPVTPPIVATSPKIILKLDDFTAKNGTSTHITVLNYLIQKQVKASLGAIAINFDNTAFNLCKPYLDATNSSGDKLIEVWHHGLDHIQPEFSGTPYAYQKIHFDSASVLIKKYLGVQMHSLGTPFNASDTVTNRVVSEDPNYKVFMFGTITPAASTGIINLLNRVDMENGVGNPDSAFFKIQFNNNKARYSDYMVLQGHPNMWSAEKFTQFIGVVEYLIAQGCEFVLPYDYYRSLTLSAPTNLAVSVISSNQVNLTWSDNTNSEYNYKIEYSTDSLNWNKLATVGANVTTYSATNLSSSSGTFYFRVYANCGIKSGYSNIVKTNSITNAIDKVTQENKTLLKVYPNPCSNQTTINFKLQNSGKVSLLVYGIDNKLLIENSYGNLPLGDYHYKTNLSGLKSGIYFFQIISPDGVLSEKIIVK